MSCRARNAVEYRGLLSRRSIILTESRREHSEQKHERSFQSLNYSVINSVLNDPELSKEYKVRAITRDVNSDKVKGLKGKVEVVRGDVSDRASLEPALTGVHTVFSMTVPSFAPNGFEIEVNNGKAIADVALEKGAKYIIFSTFPNCAEISGGKYTKVTPFDAKAAVAKYIRGLPIQSAFLSAGSFMENFAEQTFLGLRKDADGTWVFSRNISPQTRYPLIDAVGDTGKFVGAILAQPEKYEGRTFCAATRMYTLEEIVATIAKSTGKKAVYKQISTEEFRENMGVPDALADIFEEGFKCMEEYGYFGPEGEKLVQWAADNARGQPATLEEYLERHPLKLE
ncbi:HSCARG dehydrogenase [Rostrohypoxylon terebratum]|nr:HSCARG dehydrogenase [Rostrohypoxylon terebratum]